MPKAKNINNLSIEDIRFFYDYVCAYESDYKAKFGHYDINAQAVGKLCQENDIVLGKRPRHKCNIVFEASKPRNMDCNDKAHHLLRHIRNSFCHGKVTKKGRTFTLMDYNRLGNESMKAQIREDLLWSLLKTILATEKG